VLVSNRKKTGSEGGGRENKGTRNASTTSKGKNPPMRSDQEPSYESRKKGDVRGKLGDLLYEQWNQKEGRKEKPPGGQAQSFPKPCGDRTKSPTEHGRPIRRGEQKESRTEKKGRKVKNQIKAR